MPVGGGNSTCSNTSSICDCSSICKSSESTLPLVVVCEEKNAYSVLFFGLFAVVQTDKRVLANFLEGL